MGRLSGYASAADIYSSTGALTAIAAVAVLARVSTRLLVTRRAGADDIFISVAMLFSIAMGISICKQTDWGMAKHIWLLSLADLKKVSVWFWACYWLYYSALYCIKMSILLQYIRIFPYDRLRTLSFALIAAVTVWSLWSVLGSIFMCVPVQNFWEIPALKAPGCMPRLNVWYANAAVNIVTDIAIFALPLPYIKSLEIEPRQKALLMGVFGAGFFTCFVSILRLVYIYPITTSPDMTWNNALANVWSCVEVNVGILCSCAPALKGVFQRGIPKLVSSFRSTVLSGRSQPSKSRSATSSTAPRLSFKSDGEKSGLGSFLSSRLTATSSTKTSSRSLNRSYIGNDDAGAFEARAGIEVMTSVEQRSEPAAPGEFTTPNTPRHGRQSSALTTGKSRTVIEGPSTQQLAPGKSFLVINEDEPSPVAEKELYDALGVS